MPIDQLSSLSPQGPIPAPLLEVLNAPRQHRAIQGSWGWHLGTPAALCLSLFIDPSEKSQAQSRQVTQYSLKEWKLENQTQTAGPVPARPKEKALRETSQQMPSRANTDHHCVLGLLCIHSQGILPSALCPQGCLHLVGSCGKDLNWVLITAATVIAAVILIECLPCAKHCSKHLTSSLSHTSNNPFAD